MKRKKILTDKRMQESGYPGIQVPIARWAGLVRAASGVRTVKWLPYY